MSTIVMESQVVRIPGWVHDLSSFRRWADSDEFPEEGRIYHLNGEVWVDMSKEQVFTHVRVKGEYTRVLAGLAKESRDGVYFPDGLRLSNPAAEISVVPDGIYVSNRTIQLGRAHFVEGAEEGYVELEGSPDMVLEVVSTGSVEKDNQILFDAYWRAGIAEYWLVDVRKQPLRFEIYRHTSKGYSSTRKQMSWIKSGVFGKSFKLTQQLGPNRYAEYSLRVR
jgi:Uma2 family endonuclease